ncbi:hypothetical protein CCACVL1_21750 [Corchorus capsularis]|uniref:Uncharacterized protein n=1 Tax=Corchorus capsularis TaxID=210143 RepID=A0A1R3H294_COCAP|nr:hypothetical protein CCACVL1_21750 [Corchorus capsularis]
MDCEIFKRDVTLTLKRGKRVPTLGI